MLLTMRGGPHAYIERLMGYLYTPGCYHIPPLCFTAHGKIGMDVKRSHKIFKHIKNNMLQCRHTTPITTTKTHG